MKISSPKAINWTLKQYGYWGGLFYDNIDSWEVSHFEAKDHTFQTLGVRLWHGARTFLY
jgi:hypothetical protein